MIKVHASILNFYIFVLKERENKTKKEKKNSGYASFSFGSIFEKTFFEKLNFPSL